MTTYQHRRMALLPLCIAFYIASCPAANAEEIRISKTKVISHFVRDDAKEVVVDTKNKRMWQDDLSVTTVEKDWASAKAYCQSLNFAGYSDWYLPSIKVLESIAEPDNYPQAIVKGFKNVAPGNYWGSSVHTAGPKLAWGVDFKNGYSSYYDKSGTFRVRCVREGQ